MHRKLNNLTRLSGNARILQEIFYSGLAEAAPQPQVFQQVMQAGV